MTKRPISTPDPIDVAVGARIRIRRKSLGISQSALGEALGLTFQQIQKYERGTNRVSASMLVKTARKLDCSVAFLLGEDQESAGDAQLLSLMATTGAFDLLQAFAKIADSETRNAVIAVARGLADSCATSKRRSAA